MMGKQLGATTRREALLLAGSFAIIAITPTSLLAGGGTSAQPDREIVFDEDVTRFWQAFDAINATSDPAERLRLIRAMYIDPGTPGLHALMRARCYSDREYIESIARWPRFWASIRPMTLRSREARATLNRDVAALRDLYPELQPATITYAIGILRTGGTTVDEKVLIGAELALADSSIDTSDLPESIRTRLTPYFRSEPARNHALLNLHEYVHTQQQATTGSLLQQALREGVAELVTELVTRRLPALPVYTYGPRNDAAIKARFMTEMGSTNYDNWLWNSANNPFGTSDVGYYVGYRIAKSHYGAATDKRAALRTLIQLPYDDEARIRSFALATPYFATEPQRRN